MSKVNFNFSKKINPIEKEEKGLRLAVAYDPMISFTSARKLSSYLVRANLYPIDKTTESFKCTKNAVNYPKMLI